MFPYFIFKRLQLNVFRNSFIYKVDYGFNYLLRKVVLKWTDKTLSGAPGRELDFEFFCNAQNHTRQVQPIPGKLFSSPDNTLVESFAAPLPVDSEIYNINFSATAPKAQKTFNYLYRQGDIIKIDVTGQTAQSPGYCDIMLAGYYVPESTLVVNAH